MKWILYFIFALCLLGATFMLGACAPYKEYVSEKKERNYFGTIEMEIHFIADKKKKTKKKETKKEIKEEDIDVGQSGKCTHWIHCKKNKIAKKMKFRHKHLVGCKFYKKPPALKTHRHGHHHGRSGRYGYGHGWGGFYHHHEHGPQHHSHGKDDHSHGKSHRKKNKKYYEDN